MTEQEYQKYSKAQRNYLSARYEILFIIVMTIVNMFLLPTTETYYVCSISFATFQIISAILAKKDPSQFGVSAELAEYALPGAITIAIIITAVYVLFFFLSKKKKRLPYYASRTLFDRHIFHFKQRILRPDFYNRYRNTCRFDLYACKRRKFRQGFAGPFCKRRCRKRGGNTRLL